jgi:DNA-directed RNA polymerase subunit RPC12/RpoP
MQCLKCGSKFVGFKEVGYMEATCYQCQHCGFKWVGMGRPRPVVGQENALKERWESYKVYLLHGVVVWSILSIGHLGISCLLSWGEQRSFGSIWLGVGWTVGIYGVLLGLAICWALRHTRRRFFIFALPLLSAALVGGAQGASFFDTFFFLSQVSSWKKYLLIMAGAVLAMTATPIIIHRSSKILRHRGYRGEEPSPGDPRWRS